MYFYDQNAFDMASNPCYIAFFPKMDRLCWHFLKHAIGKNLLVRSSSSIIQDLTRQARPKIQK
jgi:hypothetical protein